MVERLSLCYSSFLPAFLAGSAGADFSSPRPSALPWITLRRGFLLNPVLNTGIRHYGEITSYFMSRFAL